MSQAETEPGRYGPDEDAEYLSVFWGILRVPVVCAGCGTRTRSPCHTEDRRRLCGACYRAEMWPPEPLREPRGRDTRAGGTPVARPSAPGGDSPPRGLRPRQGGVATVGGALRRPPAEWGALAVAGA